MWYVKFAINIKMQLGGAVVSTAPFCFVDAFCFVGAVLALASGKAERRQLHHSALLVQLRQLHPLKILFSYFDAERRRRQLRAVHEVGACERLPSVAHEARMCHALSHHYHGVAFDACLGRLV